jgi:hypothetical protein
MSSTKALIAEVAKLRRIQQSLLAIGDRTDEARKMDLVALRRQLAMQIGAVSSAAEQGFLQHADQSSAREFRTLMSTMRRAIALHQANFPAVRLGEKSFEYQESVKAVRDANSRFFQWADVHLRE